ncbi:hypothetical protein ASG52_12885 [Methylobacterium sp. Leaf456]|nr:hypothetical protein ASG52_12885 [Methylobacterium sp. Leaf456]
MSFVEVDLVYCRRYGGIGFSTLRLVDGSISCADLLRRIGDVAPMSEAYWPSRPALGKLVRRRMVDGAGQAHDPVDVLNGVAAVSMRDGTALGFCPTGVLVDREFFPQLPDPLLAVPAVQSKARR